jgi:hypothetical protein
VLFLQYASTKASTATFESVSKHTIIAKLSKHVQSASETCFAIHFIPGHFGQANGPMALEIFGPTTRPWYRNR